MKKNLFNKSYTYYGNHKQQNKSSGLIIFLETSDISAS